MKTKDIDAIAAIMREQHRRAMEGDSLEKRRVHAIVGELAYYFESKNSTFNIRAFERACGCG